MFELNANQLTIDCCRFRWMYLDLAVITNKQTKKTKYAKNKEKESNKNTK